MLLDDVDPCLLPLSNAGMIGLKMFNQGHYFQAHEHLEEAWRSDPTSGRELYRAILQVAVAYYQIERGNFTGAIKMFSRIHHWLDPLPDYCRGVDLRQLKQDVDLIHQMVTKIGRANIQDFDRRLFRSIEYS